MALVVDSLRKINQDAATTNPSFVLVSCDENSTEAVRKELESIPLVKVNVVEGMYELVVKIESDSIQEIKNLIASKIRCINGVRTCLTLFGEDPYKKQ